MHKNEGNQRRAGTGSMVMCQRDDPRTDPRSTAPVTPRWPGVEPSPRAPHPGTGAPGHEVAQPQGVRRSWRPLRVVLRVQTFAALHHREFRLLWAGQVATAMAMGMD